MKNIKGIIPVLLLTIVVCISVATLAITDDVTREIIAKNKLAEVQASLKTQFPLMAAFEYNEDIDVYTIFTGNETSNDSIIGYAFMAKGSGYGGTIDILISLKDLNTLNGISIISQRETPGLGTKITESKFQNQFKDISINNLKFRKDGGQIDAITGATISSTAVLKAVRETTIQKVELLKEIGSG